MTPPPPDDVIKPACVRYELPVQGVARIVLDRADKANAQDLAMLYQLDAAFHRACHDDEVRVIILAAAGKHFSAGHDLASTARRIPTADESRGSWGQFDGTGWEGGYARERELYLDLTERWRNAAKPTIAAVQGAVIAGGLMLAWACDLIICADDARFRDNTAAEMGVPGVEMFQHPFELGVRKAKEWLFTGGWLTAQEAERRGMVNRVVPGPNLAEATFDLAAQIAQQDRFTLKLAKLAINQAQDLMGRKHAIENAFSLHQLAHTHNLLIHGSIIDTSRLPAAIRAARDAAEKPGGDEASGLG